MYVNRVRFFSLLKEFLQFFCQNCENFLKQTLKVYFSTFAKNLVFPDQSLVMPNKCLISCRSKQRASSGDAFSRIEHFKIVICEMLEVKNTSICLAA